MSVEKQSADVPLSLEFRLDNGLATEAEYREWEAQQELAYYAWLALPWRVRLWRRHVLPCWWEAKARIQHAVRAIRGIECEE